MFFFVVGWKILWHNLDKHSFVLCETMNAQVERIETKLPETENYIAMLQRDKNQT